MGPEGGAEGAETFRALCRSSPWRWQSLRFEFHGGGTAAPALLGWVRRPGALRVETPEGGLVCSTTGGGDSRDGFYVSGTPKSWLLPPHLVTPVYDDHGLILRRPKADYDAPPFPDPVWAAMLDPVELAGDAPVPLVAPHANAATVVSVTAGTQDGRRVLDAVVTPTVNYRPAVPGSPLLVPGESAVRVDWQTGICLAVGPRDGSLPARILRILAVDEYMADDLFLAQTR